MINAKQIMFLGYLFFCGVLISLVMGQAWYGSTDVTTINALTVLRPVNVLGIWQFPFLNVQYFTIGLPKLMSMDFGFFGGGYGILQFAFLSVFVAGIALIMAVTAWVVGTRLFGR